METSILVLAEAAVPRLGDKLELECDLADVLPVPWVVVAERHLPLAVRQRCCCCEVHFRWQSAYGRDLGSAGETCISWVAAVLWAP